MSLTAAQTQKEAKTAEAKLRILFVSRYLWGYDGITIHLKRLAKVLQRRGHEVALVSGTDEARRQKYEDLRWFDEHMNHYYVPFPEDLSWHSTGGFTRALYNLSRIVRNFEPSIIHSHSASLAPYLAPLKLFSKASIISTSHLEFDSKRTDIKMSGLLCKVNPRWFSDHMIAISRELRSQFNQHLNIPYNMISLIPNGINHHYFRHPSREERLASRKSFGIEPEVPVVCLVGRLDPVKGHQVLFRALQEIKKSSTRVHAICAGSGETFEPEIKSLATELDLQNQIIFPGHTDARRVYWASDIKVLPSYREGNPIVISEAMLCGLPTIRTPTSGARDQTVEGKTGYIVPLDAPDQLAKRVRYLFDYPEKRKEMGRAARTYAKQHFTLEATVDQTERLYCDLASAL